MILLALALLQVPSGNVQPKSNRAQPIQYNPASPENEKNIVKLTDAERADVLLLQRDIEDAEVQEMDLNSKATEQKTVITTKVEELNKKLASLRAKYNLKNDDFFNQKELLFVVHPAQPESKK